MYKEKILELKKELFVLNNIRELQTEEKQNLEHLKKSKFKKNEIYLILAVLTAIVNLVLLLVIKNKIIVYISSSTLALLYFVFLYLFFKNKKYVKNFSITEDEFFINKITKTFDIVADTWNSEIKTIANKELINYYVSDETTLEEQLFLKSIIYNYIYFLNTKETVIFKYKFLKQNKHSIHQYNSFIKETHLLLDKQIETVCNKQLKLYSKLTDIHLLISYNDSKLKIV